MRPRDRQTMGSRIEPEPESTMNSSDESRFLAVMTKKHQNLRIFTETLGTGQEAALSVNRDPLPPSATACAVVTSHGRPFSLASSRRVFLLWHTWHAPCRLSRLHLAPPSRMGKR